MATASLWQMHRYNTTRGKRTARISVSAFRAARNTHTYTQTQPRGHVLSSFQQETICDHPLVQDSAHEFQTFVRIQSRGSSGHFKINFFLIVYRNKWTLCCYGGICVMTRWKLDKQFHIFLQDNKKNGDIFEEIVNGGGGLMQRLTKRPTCRCVTV